jgi:hypothetical protein
MQRPLSVEDSGDDPTSKDALRATQLGGCRPGRAFLRSRQSRRTIRSVRLSVMLLVLLSGCGASSQEHASSQEPQEDPAMTPRPITWEDGKEAFEAGPFGSRVQMRRVVTDMCRRWGGAYVLLDEDAKHTISSETTASRVFYTTEAQTKSDVRTKVTVIFRCK